MEVLTAPEKVVAPVVNIYDQVDGSNINGRLTNSFQPFGTNTGKLSLWLAVGDLDGVEAQVDAMIDAVLHGIVVPPSDPVPPATDPETPPADPETPPSDPVIPVTDPAPEPAPAPAPEPVPSLEPTPQ